MAAKASTFFLDYGHLCLQDLEHYKGKWLAPFQDMTDREVGFKLATLFEWLEWAEENKCAQPFIPQAFELAD